MAIVGQQLTAPETGWKRYDDTEVNIKYIGDRWEYLQGGTAYLQTHHRTAKANDKVTFNFTGPKIRIIGAYNYQDSNKIEIAIDGISYTYSDYAASGTTQVLVFEKLDLDESEHCVTITNLEDSKYFTIDAFDIDEKGEIKPYNPDVKTNQVLLRITMNDSSEREYKVAQFEVDKFISWINGTGRTGDNCYKFDDVIDDSKEYLIFEKIISFKVFEL
jgi:hypothetical protein